MSSNSQAVHYVIATALYGQEWQEAARRQAKEEEEEVTPEDSASAQVSLINKVANSLNALALICNKLANNKDIVMDEEGP